MPLVVSETTSARAVAWRATIPDASELAISAWTLTEFSSAIGMKVRRRALTPSQGDGALALLDEVLLPRVLVLETQPTDYRLARSMLAEFALGLRAGDALHLAIASRCGAEQFVAFDRTLARAAALIGLRVASV